MRKILLIDDSDGYQPYVKRILIYDSKDERRVKKLYREYKNKQESRIVKFRNMRMNYKASKGYDADDWFTYRKNGVEVIPDNVDEERHYKMCDEEDKVRRKYGKDFIKELSKFGEICKANWMIHLDI